jgi:hypothetical protein
MMPHNVEQRDERARAGKLAVGRNIWINWYTNIEQPSNLFIGSDQVCWRKIAFFFQMR